MVVTADGVWRGTKLVELKRTVEEALRICESQKAPHESHRVSHVIVVRNLLLDPATAASDKRPEKPGARPVRCAPQARIASPRDYHTRARRAAVRIRGLFLACLSFSYRSDPRICSALLSPRLPSPTAHSGRAAAAPVCCNTRVSPVTSTPPPLPSPPLRRPAPSLHSRPRRADSGTYEYCTRLHASFVSRQSYCTLIIVPLVLYHYHYHQISLSYRSLRCADTLEVQI